MAATSVDTLGTPPGLVVEPPNLCKFRPPDTPATSEKNLREVIWPSLFDSRVIGKECAVTGFPRIFTEHAQGPEDAANPNHVLEIHPATAVTCGGQELSFIGFLKAIKGMRAIKPATAASCINNRRLEVRFAGGQYQFRESGGQCGNFAIVEVGKLNTAWIKAIKGGHSAIARVSADGKSRATLKIYTLAGSKADEWLTDFQTAPAGNVRLLLHGLFTYDYFSILRAIEGSDGTLTKPATWTTVQFSLAFVVFGDTQTVPWEED